MIRWPAFIAEVASEEFRPKLAGGIVTGYGTVLALLGVTVAADVGGILPGGPWAYVLVGAKVATNTLALAAWRWRWWLVELSALNILADVVVMTGAVYFTGGILSPLVSLYFIEVAVMALLTNVGLTATVVLGCFVFYATMAVAVHVGALPAVPPLVPGPDSVTTAHVVVLVLVMGVSTFAPGLYVATMVGRLRDNERALAARARELVEAGRTRSEFTANVTHELRTPLHGILGMGELLLEGVYDPLTPRQAEATTTIRKSATDLLELIDSLLVLARAEALRHEVTLSAVDAREVVQGVAETGRRVVGARDLEIRSELASELPLLRTDRQQLEQILVNLVANAIKFTADGGRVTIAAARERGHVVLSVSDTGRGIAEADLGRIFEPYVQVDGSAVREHGGAGIGLAVVRTLAGLLQIDVCVESRLGDGSTFTLRVPAVPADE
ncbi:MAG: HAMP domain-containing histidine kinase [Polyangiaceae bacterium]|nr:HAMP domain-containing histidine kinase [Polyangiaceae bacterium]